jgi:hypothetical protein
MNALAWLLVSILGATFVVVTAFMQVSSAKRAIGMGLKLPYEVRLVSYFWLAVGIVADVAYNLTRGTVIFRELPRELLFTSRVKRHCRESASKSAWRYKKACGWRDYLNAVDPGHIREVE